MEQYVLQVSIGFQKGYYVYSEGLMSTKLTRAKVFKTIAECKKFRKQYFWMSTYETIAVSKKELFKAKLACK